MFRSWLTAGMIMAGIADFAFGQFWAPTPTAPANGYRHSAPYVATNIYQHAAPSYPAFPTTAAPYSSSTTPTYSRAPSRYSATSGLRSSAMTAPYAGPTAYLTQRGPEPPMGTANTGPSVSPPITPPADTLPVPAPPATPPPYQPNLPADWTSPPSATPPAIAPPVIAPPLDGPDGNIPAPAPESSVLVPESSAWDPYDAEIGNVDSFLATNSARNGFFIQWDHLLWTITAPDVGVIGDPTAEGNYVVDGVLAHRVNSLDTSFIDRHTDSANRWEFGWNQDDRGWIVGLIEGGNTQTLTMPGVSFIPQDTSSLINERLLAGWSDSNNDSIADDLDGDNIYGNDGVDLGTPDGGGGFLPPFDGIPDAPAPQDNDDLMVYLPVFDSFTARSSVKMLGVELLGSRRFARSTSSHVEMLYGFRVLEIEDTFGFSGSGGVLDATTATTSVRNQMLGGELGGRWAARRGAMSVALEGRLFLGANFQRASQQGSIASNFVGGLNQPAALTPFSFNSSRSNEEFAIMGEWRLETALAINRYVRFKAGYTGMLVDGYSAAAPKVQYSLPNFGMSAAASDETIYVSALTLGLEINR